jgi:quinol monooxygenase YgiN
MWKDRGWRIINYVMHGNATKMTYYGDDMKLKLGFTLLALTIVGLVSFGDPGKAQAAEAGSIRIAHLRIKPDQLESFKEAVREEMRDALRLEPGVLAIYAVADKSDPAKITFFEMYTNEEAYQIHRETSHFKKYFETTKDMIADRILVESVPVELRDKYNTPLAP